MTKGPTDCPILHPPLAHGVGTRVRYMPHGIPTNPVFTGVIDEVRPSFGWPKGHVCWMTRLVYGVQADQGGHDWIFEKYILEVVPGVG